MGGNPDRVMDLIFGRWRSQALFAGAELGIFDHLQKDRAADAKKLAIELRADPALLYRLLRALATIGLLEEDRAQAYVLTELGNLLRSDHPETLRPMARLAEGPQHYAIWKHLPAMVRDGKQNAFVREFGCTAFDYARMNADYGQRFKRGMSSYSSVQSRLVIEALRGYDFSSMRTFCDVAGGHGHLMCSILQAHPHLRGIVFDQPEVVQDLHELWAPKLGVEDRCRYVAGDMFKTVPVADAYSLKMILHDWNDDECMEILSCIRRASSGHAQVFIAEQIVPGPNEPHPSKLFDLHMMCWGTGQERTEVEYKRLLEGSGWRAMSCYYPADRKLGVIVGSCG